MRSLKEGALFISDAHDNETRRTFHRFLEKIDAGEIETPQLFLMGDMFDLLVGEVKYTHELFEKSITLLNKLSQKIEIFYFEGNHDFNLKALFPHVTVFPLKAQPALFHFYSRAFLLSHGDLYGSRAYRLYTTIIRNRFVLKLLNFIDRIKHQSLSKKILQNQHSKSICLPIPQFDRMIKQKIQKYDIRISEIDFVCEGHHHQNREFLFGHQTYKNFSSFACEKSYYRLTFKEEIKFIELFVKE